MKALLAPFALILTQSAHAAEVPLSQLSDYFETLTAVEAPFQQVNSDGTTSQGKIILKRPGNARFEYAKPDKTLVLANQGVVAIFDGKTHAPPTEYQLQLTPLGLILGRVVNLEDSRMVVDHREYQGDTHVLAQDPKHPENGQIELIFGDSPVRLKGWITTDEMGNQTSLTLGQMVQGKKYSPTLFSIDEEKKNRGVE